jgi:ATP-binding cassette, subfamily B, bacterial HlyB/CyaB
MPSRGEKHIGVRPEQWCGTVGERGSSLSGGRRQRIAIALITDPRILIFDKATSALDYGSERVVPENMRSITRGRTVLVERDADRGDRAATFMRLS